MYKVAGVSSAGKTTLINSSQKLQFELPENPSVTPIPFSVQDLLNLGASCIAVLGFLEI